MDFIIWDTKFSYETICEQKSCLHDFVNELVHERSTRI